MAGISGDSDSAKEFRVNLLDMPIYWERLKERIVNSAKILDEQGMPKNLIMLTLKEEIAFGKDIEAPGVKEAISEALRLSDEEIAKTSKVQ